MPIEINPIDFSIAELDVPPNRFWKRKTPAIPEISIPMIKERIEKVGVIIDKIVEEDFVFI